MILYEDKGWELVTTDEISINMYQGVVNKVTFRHKRCGNTYYSFNKQIDGEQRGQHHCYTAEKVHAIPAGMVALWYFENGCI